MSNNNSSGKTAHLWSMVVAAALALTPAIASAHRFGDAQPSRPLVLKAEGSFFVGGNTEDVATEFGSVYASGPGKAMINQMYVEYQKPEKNNNEYPIVFVHGCCLSSKTWETTPDGRMGWYEYFTRKGFDTYMAEQVGRARSGFDALQYEKVRLGAAPPSTNPAILIATDRFAWQVFRWGDFDTLTPYPDERFPMNTVGVGPGSTLNFYKQVIPDMTATLTGAPPGCVAASCTPTAANAVWHTPAGMAKLANDLGGAILVGHSQSSSFPTRAALQPGSKGVRGIIQLETGCFGNLTQTDINVLKNIPILVMVGDHFSTPQPPASCVTEMHQINDAGGDMTFISLPAIGIYGNSHMFMQDNNNLQIADIIIDWIKKHVRRPHRDHHGHHRH